MKNKKGQIGQLQPIIVGLVSISIVLAIGFLIMAEAKSQGESIEGLDYSNETQCAQSYTCNGTNDTIDAIADIPGWLPIIVVTLIGALLLGLVAAFGKRL